ncbi:MAG TPA: PAS domain S-box protein [Syntrophales bacterium]|nr:PAS domain S-box protein [Syntrophales bacterium]
MDKTKAMREIENNGLIIISVAAVLVYWFFDSLLSGIVFVRLMIASLIVTYGSFTQYLINSHKSVQRALMATQDSLEDEVKTRTADLVAANEELKRSERLFETLARVSPVGIFRADAQGDFVYVNDRWSEITGMPMERALGKKWADAIHPEDKDDVVNEWYASVRKKIPFNMEYQFHRSEGNSTWVLGQATAEINGDGKVSGYVGTITDISERKRAEEERMHLATAIEQTAEGLIVENNDGIIRYVNPAVERMSGYSKSELIGRNSSILNSDKHDIAFYKNIRDTLGRGEVWGGHLVNRKKDGTFYETEVTSSPVLDSASNIINYVSIHRDITREMRLERELRQAHKMEAIGTLAGGIAHDFNNILMAIIGYTEMALYKMPEQTTPVRRDLEQVLKAGYRARDLVNQILTFSHQSDQERKVIDIVPTVKEGLKLLRSSLPSTIEIRQDIAITPEKGIILADPTQIHQVLMNLCTNAAHAMRDRGGILSVSLSSVGANAYLVSRYPDLKSGPYVRLTVGDTGQGIDPAILERIFDPYFTTKGPGEGTGMGLAVVQGIVKRHGGMITVQSELGKGTSFHVLFPRIEQEIAPEAAAEVLPTGNERILFVDDEEPLVNLGKDMLESLGYSVTTETNSLKALAVFKARPDAFDLVVTDVTMPGMTGIQLAREMMTIRPDIPIILCTGFSELINEKKAKEMGIREFVMKPFVVGKHAKTIRKVLDER